MSVRQVDQVGVVTVFVDYPIASADREGLPSTIVAKRFDLLQQQREAADVPVVIDLGIVVLKRILFI